MNKKTSCCLLGLLLILAMSGVAHGQQGQPPKNTTEQVLDHIFGDKGHSEGNLTILSVPVKPGGQVKEWTVSPGEMAEYKAKAKKHNVLTKAAAEGDINTVEKLLSGGYDVNGKDEEGMTALMRAAKAGKKEMCEFLLSQKAGTFMVKGGDNSALTFAIMSGNKDIVDLILAASPENIEKAVSGARGIDRALGDAVRYGTLEMARYLVDKGALVNAEFIDRSCILSRAVAAKNREMVEFLLSRNVNVNPKENIDNPLMAAIGSQQTEIAKSLIAGGADPNTGAGNKHAVLISAARTGNTEVLNLLISKGARLDEKDTHGFTALMIAGLYGHREAAGSLIMAGADLNIKNKNCETFLMIAVRKFSKEVIELALSKGADVNVKSCEEGVNEGVTPLIAALSRPDNSISIAGLLIRKGADVNAKISWGTVLTLASMNSSEEGIKLLLENGADVNGRSENGITALMMAAAYGRKDMVELLLAKGADPALKDKEGKTAGMWLEEGTGKITESTQKEIAHLLSSQKVK